MPPGGPHSETQQMKLEAFDFAGLIKAVAAASLIGGGTVVLNTQRDNAVQDVSIKQIEDRQQKLDTTLQQLDQSVRTLDKSVAVLAERVKE
jgi:septal ring factor EnvC (AmiA/AmiB activator)